MGLVVFLTYAYRSLLTRVRASVITALAVSLFVAGATVGLAYYLSLEKMLVTAPPQAVIVVSEGAASESDSKLPLESARKIVVLDGVVRSARELVSHVYVSTADYSRHDEPSVIRGIDDTSLAVHGASLIAGALPAPGSFEVMVGRRLAKRYPHIKIGYQVPLPDGPGTVSGIFVADGAVFEDELWTRRTALELHLDTKTSSSVTLVATSTQRAKELVAAINASKDIRARAQPVAEFRAERGGLHTIARTVLVLLVLLSVVATFSIAVTMNAAVLARLRELGALAAIGIRRQTLARVVLIESTILAGVGAVVGTASGILIAKLLGQMPIGASPIEITFSPIAMLFGVVLGVVVGIVGGVLPARHVRRLDILTALR